MKREDKVNIFVQWYLNSDKTEKSYNNECKDKINVAYNTAIKYLELQEVQDIIKEKYKDNRTMNMLSIYDAMLDKALKGDVNSAKWINEFNKSDFFGDTKSEIDKIIENLDVGE